MDDALELVGAASSLAKDFISEHDNTVGAHATDASVATGCEPTVIQSQPQPRILAADTQQQQMRQLAKA